MDYEFDDIRIPSKPEEYSLPLDTAINFVYCDQPEGLAMSIYADGEEREYLGKGKIALDGGFARIRKLALLDPFLRDRSLIPSSYMKIFYLVHMPELKKCGVDVACDPEFTGQPAVKITVNHVEEDLAKIDVIWQANRDVFRTADKFTGYVIAGHGVYKGDEDILKEIPYAMSGSYTAEGEEYERLHKIYEASPMLFEILDTEFIRKPSKKAVFVSSGIDFSPVQRPEIIPKEEARGSLKTFNGPALISVNLSPRRRSVATRFLTFISEMKRNAGYEGRAAQYVPFTCYWPTYAAMSNEQKAWYFYWRSEYRNGHRLTTSISYIFVYIYELINRAYGTAEEGFENLLRLWNDYRDDFLSLDHYMPRWCVDFIFVNKLNVKPDEILRRVKISPQRLSPVKDIFVDEQLAEGLHKLDFDMLCEYSEYNIKSSKFYSEHEQEYQEKLRTCLAEINNVMMRTHNKSLLEYLAPPREKYAWESYNGAVCGRAASKYITIEAVAYSTSPRIRSFVGNVARHMENLLRKREKVNGRLRNIDLSAPVMAVIDRVVSDRTISVIKSETPAFVIDIDRARALESESWENTQKLIDAVAASEEEQGYDAYEEAITELPSLTEMIPEYAEQTDSDQANSGNEWNILVSKLEDIQKKVLIAALNGDVEAAEAAAAEEFTFTDAVYEGINDLAAETIGDIIIDIGTGEIYEEWQTAAREALGIEV